MAKNPNLDAFLPTGGFPQFLPDANRAAVGKYKSKIASKSLAISELCSWTTRSTLQSSFTRHLPGA